MPRGFLPIDKEGGWTSHDVVAKVRGITGIRKIGHAGTLDPMATGLVMLGVGPATKLLRYIQDLTKEYEATVVFGIATDSLDADGVETERVVMDMESSDLEAVVPRFVGMIDQVPPMVSALKVGGRRLHELAREGVEVERAARPVIVESIEVLEFRPGQFPEADVRVRCGKGTYIRVLGDDLARALGGRAHLSALRRTANGGFSVGEAVTVRRLEAGDWSDHLVSPADGLESLPMLICDSATERSVGNGVRLEAGPDMPDVADGGAVKMIGGAGQLLAVYRVVGTVLLPEVVLP